MAIQMSEMCLRMPQITSEEISNLRRVFMLYAYLPEKNWPDIEKCEKDFDGNKPLYDKLVNTRWKLDELGKTANPKTGRISAVDMLETKSSSEMDMFLI